MDKERQAVYRAMQQGLLSLADSFQISRIDGHALSDIFFELRLDHPEIFWVSSFKYRYFADSPNLIFIPEYLFEKSKIKDHQKAMNARVEKLARPAAKLPELEKEHRLKKSLRSVVFRTFPQEIFSVQILKTELSLERKRKLTWIRDCLFRTNWYAIW